MDLFASTYWLHDGSYNHRVKPPTCLVSDSNGVGVARAASVPESHD
jgi:hypothetical protein